MRMEHQWWCRDEVPCACTDGWKKEQKGKEDCMKKVETYQCLMLMVPLGVWRNLEALAEVEGVTPKVMAMRLIAEAGEDYYGKALEGED